MQVWQSFRFSSKRVLFLHYFFTVEQGVGVDCLTEDRCKAISAMTGEDLNQAVDDFEIFKAKGYSDPM